ncbi:MAG: hypothetical protein ACK4WD_07905 [Flavobacteriales bacterium]
MDRNLIYSAIENPRLRDGISIQELEQVREMYPYFTAAQILLAKLYQEKNDHRFADQLQKAAVYALDRKTLYQYITGEREREREREQEQEQGTGEKEQGTREQGEQGEQGTREQEVQLISLPIHGQGEEREREREQEREQEQGTGEQGIGEQGKPKGAGQEQEVEVISLPIHGQGEEIEREQEQERGERDTIHAKDLDDMTQNILVEAIQSTIELEVEEEGEQEQEQEQEREQEQGTKEQGTREEGTGEQGTGEQVDEPRTYAEWMMWKAAKQKGNASVSSEKNKEASGETLKVTAEKTEVTGPSVTVHKMQVSGPKAHQQNLIDKFIQLQPKITPGKATDYPTKDNLGKDSLEDDMTFVTETMAKLFAQQGKIDKARKVYRQLMVLHPEKSVYFAAQLKNLNQLKK